MNTKLVLVVLLMAGCGDGGTPAVRDDAGGATSSGGSSGGSSGSGGADTGGSVGTGGTPAMSTGGTGLPIATGGASGRAGGGETGAAGKAGAGGARAYPYCLESTTGPTPWRPCTASTGAGLMKSGYRCALCDFLSAAHSECLITNDPLDEAAGTDPVLCVSSSCSECAL